MGNTHLVNIDVGTLLHRPTKNRQNHEKNIQKKCISDLPTQTVQNLFGCSYQIDYHFARAASKYDVGKLTS
jgi:hypothetical protein